MSAPSAVTLLKLGGSLITHKAGDPEGAEDARGDVIRRLAGEIAAVLRGPGAPALVVGHGSGSFGHVAAARYRIHEGFDPAQPAGVSVVQERAAALHGRVLAALVRAGTAPFSIAPSSALVTAGGKPGRFEAEPLLLALRAGLLPVVYGDVVMDRERGCAICSTETVFLAVESALSARGTAVARILWAGATDGILDSEGRPIPAVEAADADAAARAAAGDAAGTDVTGGMRHRLDAALELARRGVPSRIFDGAVPGRVAAALRGEDAGGTCVRAARNL